MAPLFEACGKPDSGSPQATMRNLDPTQLLSPYYPFETLWPVALYFIEGSSVRESS